MLLGIDLGTTAIKAVLVEPDGNIVASAGMEYESLYPQTDWVEQDPHVWLETTIQVVRALWADHPEYTGRVKGVGFSGQMHGAVFVDMAGKPLRPAIIWADGRSQPQVQRLVDEFGADEIIRLTGNPLFPGFMLPSMLWVRENEPEVWQLCRKVLLPKDYLRYVFTGEFCAEPSDASSTGLFDVVGRCWSAESCRALDVDPNLLPELKESHAVNGFLMPDMAEELGLSAGIPVVCGASDQASQALGNGIIAPGEVSCTIGTGGQVFAPVNSPVPDPSGRLALYCHALPDMWHYEYATLAAGLSLRWLRDLTGKYGYRQLADMAADVPPGAEGLIFMPYLQGERIPYSRADIRGGFVGLTVRHTLGHMARALMEGVVFSLRGGLEMMRDKAGPFTQISASGGATRHTLWLQLMADIFNLPVVVAQQNEPAALGAAVLAGIGTGVFADFQIAVHMTRRVTQTVMPNPRNTAFYDCHSKRYYGLIERFIENAHS
jgi:xylulokinase